jgi:hypothetical protein
MINLIEKEPSLEFAIPVLKWLKDPESVSQGERLANAADAYATYAHADVSVAATHAAACDAATAKEWINKYFTRISITREEVESELFKGEEVEYNKEFFADTKIRIESEEHSKYVQGLAFKVDFGWGSGTVIFRHTNAGFLYFYGGEFIVQDSDIDIFNSHPHKEIFIPLPVEEAEPVNDVVQNPKLSTDYLSESKDVQLGRASQYGTKGKGERSFQAVAEAFNALTGEKLSGSDICLVQMCLKIVRQNSDKSRLHDDSLLDAVSYTSLWAEELNNEIL